MTHIPIIERLRKAGEAGEPYVMDPRDCATAVSVFEHSLKMDRESWLRVRTAKWAWAGWLVLGICVGLALPRALLILHAVVSI